MSLTVAGMCRSRQATSPQEPTMADDLPTENEAMAYANGYVAGLDAAKDQDAAALIKERDVVFQNNKYQEDNHAPKRSACLL